MAAWLTSSSTQTSSSTTSELKPGRHRLHCSVVTRAELFACNTATDLVSQLLAPFSEIPVNRAIAERAGRVAREFQLRLPDSIIAAAALEGRLVLTTRNRKHFDDVRGVRIRTP